MTNLEDLKAARLLGKKEVVPRIHLQDQLFPTVKKMSLKSMNTTKLRKSKPIKEEAMRVFVLYKKWLLAAILVCTLGAITPAGSVHALCAAQPWNGQWVHFGGSPSLAELNIEQRCYDQIHCDGNGCHPSGSDGYMHAYGNCSPTNCDWGKAQEKHEIGDWVFGIWDFGFKMSWVWAKMSSAYPDRLYVKVFSDYNDGRQDRWDYSYFIKRNQSCIDSCNGKAPGGCWCDSLCDYYGDCCEDKVKRCGP